MVLALPLMLAYRMPIVPKHVLEGQDPNQPAAFIQKPITPELLARKVSECLDLPSA